MNLRRRKALAANEILLLTSRHRHKRVGDPAEHTIGCLESIGHTHGMRAGNDAWYPSPTCCQSAPKRTVAARPDCTHHPHVFPFEEIRQPIHNRYVKLGT